METKHDKILIADDEESIRIGLSALLEEEGFAVDAASDGLEALKLLGDGNYGLLLADLKMPGMDGLQILERMKKKNIETAVIIITGKGSIDTAVDAMKMGAYDYLTKPVEPDRLRTIIPKALEHYRLLVSHRLLELKIKHLTSYEDMIGQSPRMLEIFRMIDAVADSTANIIITGESGTGKELVARAIHRKSARRHEPFIAVNCSAFPEQILENELFGHERGAFTGALAEKPGCFELAHRGTLFLDEIGEMQLETQAKILRALEERRFRRLGGKKEIEVDVRVVAATNRNLKQALDARQLREDLYYRLAVVEIDMPPLRDRLEDIALLIEEFLALFNRKNNKKVKGFTASCYQILLQYPWPGNVRELKNLIERAVILSTSDKISASVLPERILNYDSETRVITIPVGSTWEEAEKELLVRTLESQNNNKTRTARVLGISLKTLHNKLAKFKN
ncbi:MAG: sigma-54-dependent transcriptional regulator [Candidatus Zhuqueibacterota bacterium]